MAPLGDGSIVLDKASALTSTFTRGLLRVIELKSVRIKEHLNPLPCAEDTFS